MEEVQFICVSEHNKLRIKIISPGYFNNANCQFPRDIRQLGAKYVAPSGNVKLAQGPGGTYFYRVSKNGIRIINTQQPNVIEQSIITRIFEDVDQTDCLVCMTNIHNVVIAPCGHYCLCDVCASKLTTCPLCRGKIDVIVPRNQIAL